MPEIEPGDVTLKSLSGVHLWHAPMSSCSQRVRIALAKTGRDYVSHLVNLEQDEHATEAYQAIHPKGLVPALVDDGHLFIESIDIIAHLAGENSEMTAAASPRLLEMADAAQTDLKLLTFEYLFRSGPPPAPEKAAAFQQAHHNDWLTAFRRDFAAGFDPDRLDAAAARTLDGFRTLDALLADGRRWLSGATFSLSDVAWMPNVHRFRLMGWPFERTPHLMRWFDRVAARPSYRSALVDWQSEDTASDFAAYTAKRHSEGTDIRSLPALKAGSDR